MGYTGDAWGLVWYVIALAFVFEFMDASAGMGYGTALTPILFVLGFEPLQVVPAIMIQQCTAGLVGTFLHREFENVVWKFKPMSETIKVWMIIAIIGCVAVAFSITAVYGYLHVNM
ncbi:MAG: sulfite exporter TauE/SafE family protein [Deltaproteobacteria bacterium]|nr:sulfite exporter TauE/SafE family protein [Deltaproteobacteria bacterium]